MKVLITWQEAFVGDPFAWLLVLPFIARLQIESTPASRYRPLPESAAVQAAGQGMWAGECLLPAHAIWQRQRSQSFHLARLPRRPDLDRHAQPMQLSL